ncbi:hypothetical protein [Sandaracinobacteroides hominis]|uniref:hypothetical protein n=1 Tax=Sandaracinobacteroides hominis TaxID=2780086 RepID=UPI0018F288D2|nr:hypothetical protein [Sandaracinobacteroides hominis]
MRALLSVTLLGLLLATACKGPSGSFPSLAPRPGEIPRVIDAPDAEQQPGLSDSERAGLSADVARESKALADVEKAMASEGAQLTRALQAARGSKSGSEAWSNAQMALSRYDLARSPLGDIEVRLTPLLRMVDSLPGSDADRQAVESLAAATASAIRRSQQQVNAANRQLG